MAVERCLRRPTLFIHGRNVVTAHKKSDAYQHASGETGNGTGGTMAAQASIGSYGYAGTSTQEMVNLGLRHKF